MLEKEEATYQKWQKERGNEIKMRYRELKKEARREVVMAIGRYAERHIEECNREAMNRVHKWARQQKKEERTKVGQKKGVEKPDGKEG